MDGAKNEECLIAERTWKYARVPMIAKKTIVSIGATTARPARGWRMDRILVACPGEKKWMEDRSVREVNASEEAFKRKRRQFVIWNEAKENRARIRMSGTHREGRVDKLVRGETTTS